jgi:hypothetical protein
MIQAAVYEVVGLVKRERQLDLLCWRSGCQRGIVDASFPKLEQVRRKYALEIKWSGGATLVFCRGIFVTRVDNGGVLS